MLNTERFFRDYLNVPSHLRTSEIPNIPFDKVLELMQKYHENEMRKPENKQEGLEIGQELEFDVYGSQLKGTFLGFFDGNIIKIKVISDTTNASLEGDICSVNKTFLKKTS